MPSLHSVAVDNELMLEFRKLLRVSNDLVGIQYDTTFNLTRFYVSILTFLHPFLNAKDSTIKEALVKLLLDQ